VTTSLPDPADFETVECYNCGAQDCSKFVVGQDDLTGKPGNFQFVTCNKCGLAYQNPRLTVERIKDYYDEEYIAHRKKSNWGVLTPFYNRAMDKHDRQKDQIVRRYLVPGKNSHILDIGCGAGTFLTKMADLYGSNVTGVDFKDLSQLPAFRRVNFRCGLFYAQDFGNQLFDLITMWHFLEHDYDPMRTLATARDLLQPDGRLVIEVPRLDCVSWRLYRERWPGLQAPQHTVLYDKKMLLEFVKKAGLELVEYLPYGAFPSYFYLFAGLAFKLLKGRGLNLSRAIYPYFVGQLLLSPVLMFERQLNLAMQTVICRRPA
jgi:SAM-dependent methyltransferase